MMTLSVQLFGPMVEAAGERRLRLEMAGEPTCAALRRQIAASRPELAGLLSSCRFAVNQRFADEMQTLSAVDEIVLIGLVSGG